MGTAAAVAVASHDHRLRGMPPMAGDCSARFLALNRGKRVVEADLWNPMPGGNPPPGTDFMVQAYAGLPDHLTPS